jgi:hypothetical protein
MKKEYLEEDLYKPVYDFFVANGYEVRGEVNHCDVCAYKGEKVIIVELKKHLSVDLLAQAVKRQKISDLVYVAVPKPKRLTGTSKWNDICHLLRRLELGLILVAFRGEKAFIEIAVEPQPFDRQRSKSANRKKRVGLVEEIKGRSIDLNTGGSKGKKLVTAYRELSIHIACCIDLFGPMQPKKMRELGTDPKKTTSILYKNFYGWFTRSESGIYGLSDAGRQSLKMYPELAGFYKNKILSSLKL